MQDIQAKAGERLEAGTNAARDGRLEEAAEALLLAESLFHQANDPEREGQARAELAEVQRQSGAPEQAIASYEKAISLFAESGATLREANATLALGHIYRATNNLDRARNLYDKALRLFEAA